MSGQLSKHLLYYGDNYYLGRNELCHGLPHPLNRDKVPWVFGGWPHAQWTLETARHESGMEDRVKVPRQ